MGAAFTQKTFDLGASLAGFNPKDTAKQYDEILAAAPKSIPSLADPQLQLAAEAQAKSLLTQKGRKSTFLTGTKLDASSPSTGLKTLLGG